MKPVAIIAYEGGYRRFVGPVSRFASECPKLAELRDENGIRLADRAARLRAGEQVTFFRAIDRSVDVTVGRL